MIRTMQNKVLWLAPGAALLSVTLAGCGGNTATETATAPTTTGTTTTQATKDDHAHAPGEAPHAHEGEATKASGTDDHDAEIRATMAKFFPGAQLSPKPFPFNDELGKHMGEEAGLKFSGKEGNWQVFEATQSGKRVGLAVMTHSALPDGKDMHVAFAVNPKFAISHVTALDAPDNAKMQSFLKPLVGKTHEAAFKVGKDLKAPAGLSPQTAQIAADAVHKGVVILEENFNPNHDEHEHAAGAAHKEGDGHSH